MDEPLILTSPLCNRLDPSELAPRIHEVRPFGTRMGLYGSYGVLLATVSVEAWQSFDQLSREAQHPRSPNEYDEARAAVSEAVAGLREVTPWFQGNPRGLLEGVLAGLAEWFPIAADGFSLAVGQLCCAALDPYYLASLEELALANVRQRQLSDERIRLLRAFLVTQFRLRDAATTASHQ